MYIKVLFLFLFLKFSQSLNYENYKVYSINFSNNKQFNLLNWDENSNVTLISSQHKFPGRTEVIVAPDFQNEFKTILEKYKIDYHLTVNDINSFILREKHAQLVNICKGEVSFERFLRYSEIQDYLIQLAEEHTETVTLENYGLSYEKRNLTLLRVSNNNKNKTCKPIIFVDSGFHAMEWIGPSQALYIINQLVENPINRHLIDKVDWIVAPLVNPDGYEYSHTTNRFWRRTRSKGKICDGVDPNHNFDFEWMGEGASSNECSMTYAGPNPFSESETLTLSKAISKYANRTKLYLSIHSPAQCLLHPWGFTSTLPSNERELRDVGEKVASAIFVVNGTTYDVGSSFNILFPTAGTSRDWAYGVANISLSYTVELPPGGKFGFDMPPERILSVVEETFEGIKAYHRYVEQFSC